MVTVNLLKESWIMVSQSLALDIECLENEDKQPHPTYDKVRAYYKKIGIAAKKYTKNKLDTLLENINNDLRIGTFKVALEYGDWMNIVSSLQECIGECKKAKVVTAERKLTNILNAIQLELEATKTKTMFRRAVDNTVATFIDYETLEGGPGPWIFRR